MTEIVLAVVPAAVFSQIIGDTVADGYNVPEVPVSWLTCIVSEEGLLNCLREK